MGSFYQGFAQIHATRLNLPNQIKNLLFIHIVELIQID
jgi:hypothetical protein